jgi:hypothetical protein
MFVCYSVWLGYIFIYKMRTIILLLNRRIKLLFALAIRTQKHPNQPPREPTHHTNHSVLILATPIDKTKPDLDRKSHG